MLLLNTDPAWHVGFEKFIEHTFERTYLGETAACPCGCWRSISMIFAANAPPDFMKHRPQPWHNHYI